MFERSRDSTMNFCCHVIVVKAITYDLGGLGTSA